MLNTNIWTDISEGMNIVSNALRGIGSMFSLQNQTMGVPPQMDINMSRRDLPCYQQPNPNCWTMSMTSTMPFNYPAPVYTPYIPGITDPRYGMPNPSMVDNRNMYYPQQTMNMNVNPNANMYCQLPQYQSPFMNNNTVYGFPSGGRYGY